MFEKGKAEEEKFQMNLLNCKNEKERDTFRISETSFDAGFTDSEYDFFVDELKKIIWEWMFEALFPSIWLSDIKCLVT